MRGGRSIARQMDLNVHSEKKIKSLFFSMLLRKLSIFLGKERDLRALLRFFLLMNSRRCRFQ